MTSATVTEWVECGRMWAEFKAEGLLVPFRQVRFADGSTALVGDCNDNGGGCDCCGYATAEDVVASYRDILMTEVPADA
jgi:hypothetical protein